MINKHIILHGLIASYTHYFTNNMYYLFFIPQTSQVNQGSVLSPDFSAALSILKLPFLHMFTNVDKVSNSDYFNNYCFA